MRTLLVLLPIFLFLLLLLFARIRFTLTYNGDIRCAVWYLPFRFSVYPRKKRKKSKKRTRRARSAKRRTRGKAKKRKKRPLGLSDVRLLLHLFADVLGKALDDASRHVRIRIKHLHLTVGGANDAARAAIEYGLATQAVSYFIAILDDSGFLRRVRQRDVTVEVNFLESGYAFALDATAECRLIFLIPLLFRTLKRALLAKNKWSRHRARAAAKKRNKTQKKETDHG